MDITIKDILLVLLGVVLTTIATYFKEYWLDKILQKFSEKRREAKIKNDEEFRNKVMEASQDNIIMQFYFHKANEWHFVAIMRLGMLIAYMIILYFIGKSLDMIITIICYSIVGVFWIMVTYSIDRAHQNLRIGKSAMIEYLKVKGNTFLKPPF